MKFPLYLLGSLFGIVCASGVAARSVTLSDLLSAESIEGTALLDDGSVLYEKRVAYDKAPFFSSPERTERTGSRIYVRRKTGAGAVLLFPQRDDTDYWLGPLAPAGRRMIVYSLRAGLLQLGWYDFDLERYGESERRPFVDDGYEASWISAAEIAFIAIDPGKQARAEQYQTGFSEEVHQRRLDAWNNRRSSVQAEYVEKGALQSPDPGDRSLVVLNIETRGFRTLARDRFHALTVSPDGRQAAVFIRRALHAYASDKQAESSLSGEFRHDLALVDIATGAVKLVDCNGCEPMANVARWSDDASYLTFFAREPSGQWKEGWYWSVVPATGHAERVARNGLGLIAEALGKGNIAMNGEFIPLHDGLFVYASDPQTNDRAWYLVRRGGEPLRVGASNGGWLATPLATTSNAIAVAGAGAVWRLGTDGKAKQLTPPRCCADLTPELRISGSIKNWRIHFPAGVATSLKARKAFTISRGGQSEFNVRTFDHPENQEIAGAGANGKVLVTLTRAAAGDVLQVQVAGQPARQVATANRELGDVEFAARKFLAYSIGGKTYESCVLLPPGWKKGADIPVIVEVYPGSSQRSECESGYLPAANRQYGMKGELFAAHGFVYVLANTSASLVGSDKSDVLDMNRAVEPLLEAIAAQGIANTARAGLLGESYGGYGALVLATQSHAFKAVIATHAATNLASIYGQVNESGARLLNQFAGVSFASMIETRGNPLSIGAAPWQKPQMYVAKSPLFAADRITAPVMLITGDMDVYPMAQSQQMFAALWRQGKDAALLTYWGEGHGVVSPRNIEDVWSRMLAWYDRYLRE